MKKSDLLENDVDVTDSNFESQCLDEVIFYNKFFGTINFENCSFLNAKFENIIFNHVIFKKCDLSNVEFNNCGLHSCMFIDCKLVGANFLDTLLKNVEFNSVVARYIGISYCKLNHVSVKESTTLLSHHYFFTFSLLNHAKHAFYYVSNSPTVF